jgi:hypothetical protein
VAALACLVLLVTPALIWRSQSELQRAADALLRGDCVTGIDAALDSASALSVRPEPYEVLGYCDLREGAPGLAVAAMSAARRRDPQAWRYTYGLAIAEAIDGRDPRATMRAAKRLNPLDPRVRSLARGMNSSRPADWRRAAAGAQLP